MDFWLILGAIVVLLILFLVAIRFNKSVGTPPDTDVSNDEIEAELLRETQEENSEE